MTLFSRFLMAVLSRPSVTTTAIVMTPRTTAYSAIVWPASSLTSAWRPRMKSVKEIHLLRGSEERQTGDVVQKAASHSRLLHFRISASEPEEDHPFWCPDGHEPRFGIVRARGDDHRRQAGGGGRARSGQTGRDGAAGA